ncbi:uncharacterized protein LOC144915104 [Branchiostoma floridae x Branchiostoma belcheri]
MKRTKKLPFPSILQSSVQSPIPLGSPNLGVMIFPSQLLNAELAGGGKGSCFLRKLMDVYFTKQVLAASSYKGKGRHAALDEDIMAAIISTTIQKYPDLGKQFPFAGIIDNKCTKGRKCVTQQKEKPRCFQDNSLMTL